VYYTRELLFSPSTAMKSRPAYYARVCSIHEILWYLCGTHITTRIYIQVLADFIVIMYVNFKIQFHFHRNQRSLSN